MRDIKKRAVRKPLWVTFTALSHLDDVSGEDCTGSGRIVFGCPRSLAVLKPSPSILKRILQDTDLVRTKFVWRKTREKTPHCRPPPSDEFYTSARFKLIYRKLVRFNWGRALLQNAPLATHGATTVSLLWFLRNADQKFGYLLPGRIDRIGP